MTLNDPRILALIESRLAVWLGGRSDHAHDLALRLVEDIETALAAPMLERRIALRARQVREREAA